MKQGNPLSSNLFNAALEEIIRELHWDSYGLSINGPQLCYLRFSHGIVIKAKSSRKLEIMLHELKQVGCNAGLTIYPVKAFLL